MSSCVITAGEILPGLPVLAHIFASVMKTDRDSAARAARHCWGVLGENLEETAADEIIGQCAVFGVKALKLPSESVAPLAEPRTVKKAVFEGGAAHFTDTAGSLLTVTGDSVAVVAAAPIKQEFFRTIKTTEGPSGGEKAIRFGIMAVTGLPIGLGKSKEVKKEVRSSELSFYLDLLAGPPGARLRLTSEAFDFSGLKEKKTYSSQVNFRLLCAELAAFAPAAFKNAGLRAILEGAPLALLPYDSLADLEKETLRLALARGK